MSNVLTSPGWVSEGAKVGAVVGGTILADAGPFTAGNWTPRLIVSANVEAFVTLEHRDAANAATLEEWVFGVNGGTFCFDFSKFGVPILLVNDGERLRVTLRLSLLAGSGVFVAMAN